VDQTYLRTGRQLGSESLCSKQIMSHDYQDKGQNCVTKQKQTHQIERRACKRRSVNSVWGKAMSRHCHCFAVKLAQSGHQAPSVPHVSHPSAVDDFPCKGQWGWKSVKPKVILTMTGPKTSKVHLSDKVDVKVEKPELIPWKISLNQWSLWQAHQNCPALRFQIVGSVFHTHNMKAFKENHEQPTARCSRVNQEIEKYTANEQN